MYVRNKQGKLVYIKRDKYSNDRDFYIDLWRIKYGIKIAVTTKIIINFLLNNIPFTAFIPLLTESIKGII